MMLAVSGFFFFWKLSSFGLLGADEPRYAQVAREMLARHDWITPTLSGSPWLEKPPLYYWQAILSYKIFGVSDWAARIPPALDALAMVLAVYWFLRRFRPGFELNGALMVATTAGVVGYARAGSMDMPLAATFTIAMLAWYAWFESGNGFFRAAFYAFLALGMLAKGPVAPLLGGLVVLVFSACQRNFDIVRKTLSLTGTTVFCVIALPWYALVQIRNPDFFHAFVVEHNLARFGTNLYHHPEPFWYYIPVTLLGWVPWTVFAAVAMVWAFRRSQNVEIGALSTFLAIWIAVTIFFFSISQSKLPGYVLPALPPGIVLIAEYARTRLTERPHTIFAAFHALITALLMFFALNIQYVMLEHRILWARAAVPAGVAIVVAAIVFAAIFNSGYIIFRLVTLVPLVMAMALTLRLGSPLLDNKLSARPVWTTLSAFNSDHLPIAIFLVPRETEFGLQFYCGQRVARYEAGEVPAGEHLVIAAAGYPKGVAKLAGRQAVYLGKFPPQKLEYFYVPRH